MNVTKTDVIVLPLKDLHNNTGQIAGVPANPRLLRDDAYKKLLASLKEDNLTGVLPLKVYKHEGQWVVLGGNMRLRALQELNAKEVSCIVVPENTDAATLRKIVINDNSTFGEWDMDLLANDWDTQELADWGVDLPKFGEDLSHLLDEANFESLNDIAREQTGLRQITFLFSKEDAEKVEEYCKVNSKKFLTEKIVDICRQQEAK